MRGINTIHPLEGRSREGQTCEILGSLHNTTNLLARGYLRTHDTHHEFHCIFAPKTTRAQFSTRKDQRKKKGPRRGYVTVHGLKVSPPPRFRFLFSVKDLSVIPLFYGRYWDPCSSLFSYISCIFMVLGVPHVLSETDRFGESFFFFFFISIGKKKIKINYTNHTR